MKKIISIILIQLLLAGCSFPYVHKLDVEQGNIFNSAEVDKLHRGMTEAEVKNILGTPVLTNIFTPNRMVYVYTSKPGRGELTKERITLIFQQGRLQEIQRSGI